MRKFSMNVLAVMAVTAFAAVATAQPASFVDLGVIGPAGTFTFDTIGSSTVPMGTAAPADLDTELGLYDASGILLAQDDDGAGIAFFSQITATLGPGQYFLASSEFNSDFADGFVNNGTGFEPGEVGVTNLNIDGVFAGSATGGGDGSGFDQNVFFGVTVSAVPEPTTGAVVAICGLVGLARRRRA